MKDMIIYDEDKRWALKNLQESNDLERIAHVYLLSKELHDEIDEFFINYYFREGCGGKADRTLRSLSDALKRAKQFQYSMHDFNSPVKDLIPKALYDQIMEYKDILVTCKQNMEHAFDILSDYDQAHYEVAMRMYTDEIGDKLEDLDEFFA